MKIDYLKLNYEETIKQKRDFDNEPAGCIRISLAVGLIVIPIFETLKNFFKIFANGVIFLNNHIFPATFAKSFSKKDLTPVLNITNREEPRKAINSLLEWIEQAPPQEQAARDEAAIKIYRAYNKRQYTLSLTNSTITSLPSEIGILFRHLRNIDLSHNQLTSLPPEIALGDLNYLDLSNNQLTSLPPEIGFLPVISYLDLSNNQLTSLPREIGNLSFSLSNLKLSNNPLTFLPPEIDLLRPSIRLPNLPRGTSNPPNNFHFDPLKDALCEWLGLNSNALPPEYQKLLTHQGKGHLLTFLNKVKTSEDYKAGTDQFKTRIQNILKMAAENDLALNKFFLLLPEANTDCADATIHQMDDMEVTMRLETLDKLDFRNQADFRIRFHRLQTLDRFVQNYITIWEYQHGKSHPQSIHVSLEARIALKEFLPTSAQHHYFQNCAELSPLEKEHFIADAKETILKDTSTIPQQASFLCSLDSWTEEDRLLDHPEFPKEIKDTLEAVQNDLENDSTLTSLQLKDAWDQLKQDRLEAQISFTETLLRQPKNSPPSRFSEEEYKEEGDSPALLGTPSTNEAGEEVYEV